MTNPTLQLPLTALLPVFGVLALCLWLVLSALSRMAQERESATEPMLPLIGSDQPGHSPLHNWDPRWKIAAILLFAFCAVALNHPVAIAGALGVAVAIVRIGRLPWARSLRRLQAMNGFLAMFLIVMPLTAAVQPDDFLVIFGGLTSWPLNLRGLKLALLIIGKAWTLALLMEPLLATAPLGATIWGLTRLGLPTRVSELLLIAHRYLHVFFDELQRMRRGMEARGFHTGQGLAPLSDYGNFIGMLLVRSYERTHRVYDAMQARGYSGTMPDHYRFATGPADRLKGLLLVTFGLGLLLGDQLLRGGS